MATTITTSTTLISTLDTASSSRCAAYDSTGRLWVVVHNGASGRYEMWYSDDGTSFTEATSLRLTASAATPCLHIDKTADRALFSFGSSYGGGGFKVCYGITETGTWTGLLPTDASWNSTGSVAGEAQRCRFGERRPVVAVPHLPAG